MFKKATKAKAKARVALVGPSGAGKTFTGLLVARGLADGGKVAVIDTERGSASKYSGMVDFDVCELDTFEPHRYIEALNFAAEHGYAAVVIDSLTHAWTGTGGILDQKDKAGSNNFDAWRKLTPMHNELVDAILASPCHIVATMRTKTQYEVTRDANGKTKVEKLGLAPVQRDGMEYEFDVIGSIDQDHTLHVTKSRCSELADKHIRKPGDDVAAALRAWLSDGVDYVEEACRKLREAPDEASWRDARRAAMALFQHASVADQSRIKEASEAGASRLKAEATAEETAEESAA